MNNNKLNFLCEEIKKLSKEIKELNTKMERIERKTDDIHQYVPFVGWLEGVGRQVVSRWSWISGVSGEPPRIRATPFVSENSDE